MARKIVVQRKDESSPSVLTEILVHEEVYRLGLVP